MTKVAYSLENVNNFKIKYKHNIKILTTTVKVTFFYNVRIKINKKKKNKIILSPISLTFLKEIQP